MELSLVLIKGMQSVLNGIKEGARAFLRPRILLPGSAIIAMALNATAALAQSRQATTHEPGGEANLRLPDLSQVKFMGIDGHTLLLLGLVICFLGLLFGLLIYQNLKKLPVHGSMREISELIYETCKTYLITQGRFILILEAFIAVIIVLYFGLLLHFDALKRRMISTFSASKCSRRC